MGGNAADYERRLKEALDWIESIDRSGGVEFNVILAKQIADMNRRIGACAIAIDDQDDEIARLKLQLAEKTRALEKSVKLQSHYAELLNNYDGGQRLTFASAEEWMKRLRSLEQ